MPMQVLINLFIGFLWMFFQDDWSALTFLSGYLFGIFVLFILRRFFPSKFYLLTLYAAVRLLLIFMREVLISAVLVIREIIRPQIRIKPGIMAIETSLETDVEVTLLALLITLTPGSVVVEITHDKNIFYTHVMDVPELSYAVLQSKDRFEEAIKKVTR
ncbi:MAG: Na+/H+ antiporter subunit E [Peptococcaceae bacterium]|nr:Na+/H+ antiporter subunit E [Peptococcaceae bacterium]